MEKLWAYHVLKPLQCIHNSCTPINQESNFQLEPCILTLGFWNFLKFSEIHYNFRKFQKISVECLYYYCAKSSNMQTKARCSATLKVPNEAKSKLLLTVDI
jgi:hypothetical protein